MKNAIFSLMTITLLALAACTSSSETTSWPTASSTATDELISTPAVPQELLPRTLFYLGTDSAGVVQVYRLGRDGNNVTQLTFEGTDVTDYDVSLADGSVAFVANNQLFLILADGTNRRVLLDAGPRENNFWITNPLFSPDGRTLAYGYKGLNLYDVETGVSRLVIEDQNSADILPNGLPFPIEAYEPELFSPDGTKLLVALGHWEMLASHAIYYPGRNELVRQTDGDGSGYCCSFFGGPAWSPDGSSYYGVASEHDFSFPHGALWKVDAATGAVLTLIPLVSKDGSLNLPYKPFPAPDGHLYYFFLNYPEPAGEFDRPSLQLVRSGLDGISDRSVVLPETFKVNEALWAPDAIFVVVSLDDGTTEVVYPDGRPRVELVGFARHMKWGP